MIERGRFDRLCSKGHLPLIIRWVMEGGRWSRGLLNFELLISRWVREGGRESSLPCHESRRVKVFNVGGRLSRVGTLSLPVDIVKLVRGRDETLSEVP